MNLMPKGARALLGSHRHHSATAKAQAPDQDGPPPGLDPKKIRAGMFRLVLFVGVVVAVILAVPGLGSIRGRLAHGSGGWLILAGGFRLSSALCYVVLFRQIFSGGDSRWLNYQIGMSEIGVNALVPAGGAGGLALGDWVLHRRKGVSWDELGRRSAEFFVFTSAFNVGAVAVLGWLGTAGVLSSHVSRVYSAVPALAATIVIVLALGLMPRLAGLNASLSKQRARSLRWWLLQLAVGLGTGAQGAVSQFRKHNPTTLAAGAGYLCFDIATLWAAVHAFHGHIAVEPLAMAYLVGQLAGEIPIPGGLGAVEGGLIGALALFGLPVVVATAGTLAYRAIALGIPVVFGGLAALTLAHTIRAWDRAESAAPVEASVDVGCEPRPANARSPAR
jgi:uncharacterized membrane protein YbhN (UPF0104 family)